MASLINADRRKPAKRHPASPQGSAKCCRGWRVTGAQRGWQSIKTPSL